ncbi:MAG: RNA methyltransferase [Oligoflexia bacterium]|nr:RNA methyltransferase [Oligoflexia bacterium]
MPHFFATTPRGLENVLNQELHDLGIKKTKIGVAGVGFESNWEGCYKANLCLVSASRVLYPVLDFPAYEPEQIYHNVLKHDWTKYIKPNQTIAMDSSVRDSKIKDLRIVALKAKDAVVDQFREKFNKRPDVDADNPQLPISLRLAKNICTVSLDTSGGSLHARGYRDRGAPAPLKENLAAALIKMTGWDEKSPLLDPMCGSGTFCIEAAMMALKKRPGIYRKRFAFQNWLTYQKEKFEELVKTALSEELDDVPFRIYGFDNDPRAIAASKANSENAETIIATLFKRQDLSQLEPPAESGVMVVNPPYGERMGDIKALLPLYEELGQVIHGPLKNWKCFVLSSEPEFIKALGGRPKVRHRVFNGAIQCEFVGF